MEEKLLKISDKIFLTKTCGKFKKNS